ncbi:MAG TPA: glycosyltransferase family 39 protein [Chloroflexia bacterium]|nr:glycosyltransferase family 39 protein [Chloroflexia bacterium]
MVLILSVVVAMLLLISPEHVYPVMDDYLYAGSVRDMLQTGQFHMPGFSQANLVALTVWGTWWSQVLGFSFTTLTYSVVTLAAVALVAFYGLARLLGVTPGGALLGTVLLGVNPMFVHLSYSFMTDVPFLALVLTACYCYVRGLEAPRPLAWLLAAGILSGLAFLIRQFGVLVPAAFGAYLVLDMMLTRRRRLVALLLTGLVPGLIVGAWWLWTRDLPPTPVSIDVGARAAAFIGKPVWARIIIVRTLIFLSFAGWFTWAALPLRRRRWWLVPLAAVLVVGGMYGVRLAPDAAVLQTEPPFVAQAGSLAVELPQDEYTFGLVGSIIRQVGIDFDEYNYPQQPIWSPEAWRALWVIGALLGILLLAKIADGFLDWLRERRGRRPLSPLVGVYLLGLLTLFTVTAFPADIFARYLLSLTPFLILYAVRGAAGWSRPAWGYSLAACAILAVFTVLLKADNMDHNNTRWAAGLAMEARTGAVRVGWNWDHWDHRDSEVYRIGDAHAPGFRTEQRYPYMSRLSGFQTRYVLAESKGTEQRPQILGGAEWAEARGVGVLPDGRVVVGDTGHHRLLVYAADGKLQATVGSEGSGPGMFNLLSDVAVNAQGEVLTLDAGNGDLQIFSNNPTGLTPVSRVPIGSSWASGVAWAPDGSIYVANTAGGNLMHFSRQGTPLAPLHTGSGGIALPDQPLDVVVTPAGILYAIDIQGRLVRFTVDGATDAQWLATGGGGTLGGPHLAMWGLNTLAITDPDASRVVLFDLNSGTLRDYPVTDSTPLSLQTPVGVAAQPDGRLAVLDSGHNRVVLLDSP